MVASWLGMRLNDGPGDLLVSYWKNDDKVHPRDFPGCSATLFFMQRGFFLTMLKSKMLGRYLLLFLPPSAGKAWNMCQLPGGILLGSAVYECLWSWRGHISSVLYCCRRDGNLRGKGQGRFSNCLDPTMQTILYWLYCSCIGKGWYCWYFNTKISLPVCHCSCTFHPSWLPRHFIHLTLLVYHGSSHCILQHWKVEYKDCHGSNPHLCKIFSMFSERFSHGFPMVFPMSW